MSALLKTPRGGQDEVEGGQDIGAEVYEATTDGRRTSRERGLVGAGIMAFLGDNHLQH